MVNGRTLLADADVFDAEAWLDANVKNKTKSYIKYRDMAVFHDNPELQETLANVKDWIECNMEEE